MENNLTNSYENNIGLILIALLVVLVVCFMASQVFVGKQLSYLAAKRGSNAFGQSIYTSIISIN